MRDYLSPAKKVAERVIPHPAAVRSFMAKRSLHVFVAASLFVVIITLSFVTVRGLTGSTTAVERTVTDHGKTATTMVTSEAQQPPTGTQTQNSVSITAQPGADTTVTVNDQPVNVPANGSSSQTIVSDDGTTRIDVSTSSETTDGSYSSSVSSTTSSTNVSSSTSQHIRIDTQ